MTTKIRETAAADTSTSGSCALHADSANRMPTSVVGCGKRRKDRVDQGRRDGCVTEKPGFMYSALPTIRTPGLAVGHSAVRSILQGHDDGKKGTPYEQVVWRPADRGKTADRG